ncbi:putative GntR-family transcriptional regulator [Longimycelium tulufanense]|uniref:Putative GntR-family transcriptional regulator n=1 Tax=Longimycelium tulufanense TaxID=907463 RepID=A0A8J3CHF8_9PSEU|nr:GntR family transcriptional regulator [Longimycelium tulufanense]GGM75859.1 putative GntR-family transcriptional regulator [Longimycelium tulufanense]
MARKTDGRPRYQQIAADLRKQIMSGDLPIGSRLPSIAELVTQFSVSTRTIQDAIQTLKDEGVIEAQHGRGLFVRSQRPHVVEVDAYFEPAPGGYTYDLLDVVEVIPPVDVAQALRLDPGQAAVLRHRMTRYAGDPVELHWSYYPVDIARGTPLTRRTKIRGGAPQVLAEAGYPERKFVDRVSVRPPTSEEFLALDLPETVQVICQFRVIYSDDQRPVEVTVMAKAGHLYELQYEQHIS